MDRIAEAFDKYKEHTLKCKEGDVKSYIARHRSKIIAAYYKGPISKQERKKLVNSKEFYDKGKEFLKGDPKFKKIVKASSQLNQGDRDLFNNNLDIVESLLDSGVACITKDMIKAEIHNRYLKQLDDLASELIEKSIKFYHVNNIEELCNIANEKYQNNVIKLLENHFLHEEQSLKVIDYCSPYGNIRQHHEPLTIDNFQEYVESLPCVAKYEGWSSLVDDLELDYTPISNLMEMVDQAIKDSNFEFESDEQRWEIKDTIVEMCEWNLSYYVSDDAVNRIFTLSHIEELLSKNPHHAELMQAVSNQRKREAELQKMLLSYIPDDYTLLYPLAREMKRKFILHIGPTNSGKTYHAVEKMIQCTGNCIYLAPLRLLAFEQFEKLNASGVMCSLLTGEEEIQIPGATAQSSTVEMLDISSEYDLVVIDECQMISDEFRGGAWTQAILGARSSEIHLCMAPYAKDIVVKLIEACHDDYEIIEYDRLTPLTPDEKPFYFPKRVQAGDALIVFSRKSVHAVASHLQRKGYNCSVIYGALPYDVRHEEARKFATGENSVLVSTDAIGMGLNLPIKRVVFLEDSKFDGHERRPLKPEEIQQIAGRAGRSGIYDNGFFNVYTSSKKQHDSFIAEYSANVQQIKEARFAFPQSLIGLDAPLSEILKRWNELPDTALYNKNSCDQMIKLAEELERECDDKELIYRFISIPFDAKYEDLHLAWKSHFYEYLEKGETSVLSLPSIDFINTSHQLKKAEEIYEQLDLEYQICRKFGDSNEIDYIVALKESVSKKIMEFLSKQSLQGKVCSICGKPLPWGYKYGRCDKCHESALNEWF